MVEGDHIQPSADRYMISPAGRWEMPMRLIAMVALAGALSAADDASTIRPGKWSVEFEVVDASSDLMGAHSAVWVGHRWDGENCLLPGAPISTVLNTVAYQCEPIRVSTEKGRLVALRSCRGGHALPGFGTETITASIRGDRFVGVSDITLVTSEPVVAVTRFRAVVSGYRKGDCS